MSAMPSGEGADVTGTGPASGERSGSFGAPEAVAESGPARPAHVYAHVPLCRSKCHYCDFYSIPGDDRSYQPLVDALVAEAMDWSALPSGSKARTLYVGGGTPTLLNGRLVVLVDALREAYGVATDAEVTVEANPDSLTAALAEKLVASGVTRVSVGVQSFDNSVLEVLGRPHDAAAARRSAKAVLDAGLSLSLDLICGVPTQSMASWMHTLEQAISTGASHVSVYPLEVEVDTEMERMIENGQLPWPNPDLAADMMLAAEERLEVSGIRRYEVANLARPGFESQHNTAYWTGKSYVGLGPAAHGMMDVPTAVELGIMEADGAAPGSRVRYSNRCDLLAYLGGSDEREVEVLTPLEALREDAMLGLRMREGITDELARSANVEEDLWSLTEGGLVEHVAGMWRTTRTGWLLGNEVFGRVWHGREETPGPAEA